MSSSSLASLSVPPPRRRGCMEAEPTPSYATAVSPKLPLEGGRARTPDGKSSSSSSSSGALVDVDKMADCSLGKEEEEYRLFLQEQERLEKEQEEKLLAEAAAELAADERTRHFKEAMSVVDDTIARANRYHEQMSSIASKMLQQFKDSQQPATLSGGTLRDYQLEGFRWLQSKFLLSESGIIADEMGLGKTVQIISLVSWLHETKQYNPVAIIVPLTTVGNWIAEFKRFAPTVPVVRYRGDKAKREELRAAHIPREAFSKGSVQALSSPMPVFVMAYSDAMADYKYLQEVRWRVLVLDEGHRIKNENSATRNILKHYSAGSTGSSGAITTKILLSGTPVQNDVVELWSLCNFIMPAVFKQREEFLKIYRFIGFASGEGLNRDYYLKGEQKNRIVSKLHSLLARYMLRRTKAQVKLSLPPKVEALIYTPLSIEQVRMLKALEKGQLAREITKMGWIPTTKVDDPSSSFIVPDELVEASSSSSSSSSSSAAPASEKQAKMLKGLGVHAIAGDGMLGVSTVNLQMMLRKICAHPFWIAEPPLSPGQSTDNQIITASGKMRVLDKMLRRLKREGHKVLIFSQFTSVLAILEDYLNYVGKDVLGEYRVVHGGVSEEDRDRAIQEFNAEPVPSNNIFAFLLSTKAGGQGINLVAADTVIFFDSDWNPTGDQQAMDRAHRIGQTRPVVVYRLVTEGASVERRMVRKAALKGSLAKMVLQEGRYLLEEDAAEDDGNEAASGAGATAPALGSNRLKSAGPSSYGVISAELLRYWLRGNISDSPLITGGIQDDELSIVLDRYRALQAGQRVADEVEAELLRKEGIGEALEEAGAKSHGLLDEAPSSSSAGGSGHKRQRDTAGDALVPHADAAPAKRTRKGHADEEQAEDEGANRPLHIAPPPRLKADASSKKAVIGAEKEQVSWSALASKAPFTPSRGRAYEFVYHASARGILAAPSSLQSSNVDLFGSSDSSHAASSSTAAVSSRSAASGAGQRTNRSQR